MLEDSHRFCVAPMMDWTDRHCRFFHRLMTRRARLYTEMVTADAVIHGDRARLLAFAEAEHPVALQLGGSLPDRLATAARIGADLGYDEINLNVGCPSDRVQVGRFGACLMAEPRLVGDCVAAMRAAVDVPVTVKCRIGIDEQDGEADFQHFIETVASAGCSIFIVHARTAWLKGLSPKENREVPPLDYERVHRLKLARPDLTIVLNGGITGLSEASDHLGRFDGVMLGRAAYQTPWLLASVDDAVFGVDGPVRQRDDVIEALMPYAARHIASGGRLNNIARHILGIYHGEPGARLFRRHLSEQAVRPDAGPEALVDALRIVQSERRRHETTRAA
ncbi:MAG: tRNA dihydrouridine(20/20a) synthase DusA [Hyphomicrobiaceae bacterium]